MSRATDYILTILKKIDFRIICIFLSIIILITLYSNFLRTTRNVTDENIFVNAPANTYFNKDIASSVIYQGSSHTTSNNNESGHLIIAEKKENNSDSIHFQMFNPEKQISYSMNVRKKEFSKKDTSSFAGGGALITTIHKDGASDRAGLKVGDIIVAIKNNSFRDVFGAGRLIEQHKPGAKVQYTVMRKGMFMNFYLQMAKYGIPFILLELTFYCLLSIGFALFVGLKRPKLFPAKLISTTFLFMATLFISYIPIIPGNLQWYQILEYLLTGFAKILLFPFMFHSFAYFPSENKFLLKNKWLIIIPYIAAILVYLNSLIRMIAKTENNVLYVSIVIIFGAFCIIYLITFFMISVRKKAITNFKSSFLIFFTVLIIPILIVLGGINSLWLFEKMQVISLVQSIYFYLVNSMVAIPIIWFFVLRRNTLLNFNIRIKRYTLFYLTTAMWQMFALALIMFTIWIFSSFSFFIPQLNISGTAIEVIDSPGNYYNRQQIEKFIFVIFAIGIVYLLWKLKSGIQNMLSTKFYRTKFDYKKASTELSDILSQSLTLNQLSHNITGELQGLLFVKRIGILIFRDEERLAEQSYVGFKSEGLSEICKATGYRLIETIKEFRIPFNANLLPEPIKSVFAEFEINYVVPIISKQKVSGALLLGEKMSEGTFKNEDFKFFSSIAGQISVSIDNGFLVEDLSKQERIKHELDIARRIQLASLPQTTPKTLGLDISGISIPALEVGGDFYDYLDGNPSELTVIVGDVSGKGTSAALYMSKVQGIMRTLHEFELHPRKLLISSNLLMSKYLEKSYFITAICAMFNTEKKKILYSRAGHLPIYYYNATSMSVEKLTSKGMLLGYSKDRLFERNLEESELSFVTGDIFVFVTDGVVEARNNFNIEFGEERLIKTIYNSTAKNADEIRNNVLDSVQAFSVDVEQYDDLTVVIVKIT